MKYINKKLSIENVKVQNIAKKFGTDVKVLRRANKLKDNTIKIGQQLIIVQE